MQQLRSCGVGGSQHVLPHMPEGQSAKLPGKAFGSSTPRFFIDWRVEVWPSSLWRHSRHLWRPSRAAPAPRARSKNTRAAGRQCAQAALVPGH